MEKTVSFSRALNNGVRALRLPFTLASVFPFIAGSFLAGRGCKPVTFLLGLLAVVGTHLSANLMNDYADSKSGVDWQDRRFFGFFGGSKLIQENVFSERSYLLGAVIFFLLGFSCIGILAYILRSMSILLFYISIVAVAWLYSHKPLQLSYRRLGEAAIFLLFGPVPVMGGYFIQTKIFPTLEGFCVSLPFAFLTTAILFANEVPDFPEDAKAGKLTWVSIVGPRRAYVLYAFLVFCALVSVAGGVMLGYLHILALGALIFVVPLAKATCVLKAGFNDKMRLIESSRLTILSQACVGIVVIIGAIRWIR